MNTTFTANSRTRYYESTVDGTTVRHMPATSNNDPYRMSFQDFKLAADTVTPFGTAEVIRNGEFAWLALPAASGALTISLHDKPEGFSLAAALELLQGIDLG
jgi:hypothetical protein